MKTYIKFLFVLLVIPMILTTGCKEEATDKFVVLKDYMVENNMDVTDVINGWITGASAVVNEADGTVPDYYVMDIRAAADYDAGHIKGAVNSSLGNILADAASATKPILVVCYTGQSAGHAVTALRLSGYPDAKVLKWGMSGWNPQFSGPWLANSGAENGNKGIGHANWTLPADIAADSEYDNPVFDTQETDGAAILAERVNEMISGFNGVASGDVLENPGNYFINNYWDLADTEHYGHIAGSHRIKPLTLEGGEYTKLDPDATVVTYCWTGQTSSMMTAYLKVLGYDSKSLKFGVNSMIYPSLEGHKFTEGGVGNYDYE